jgi:peptidylprolyl isomerase
MKKVCRTSCAALLSAVLAPFGTSAASQIGLTAPPDAATVPADAEKTASGLASKVLTPGKGSARPAPTDLVTLHYSGWSSDGELVDSTQSRKGTAIFPLDKTGLPGFRECVELMTVGERRRCWVPEKLAYNGAPKRPKGMIVFDVELVEARPSPLIPPPDVKAPPADAQQTASGLSYKILRAGTGTRMPRTTDSVRVHYTGWTTNGRMFDSSIPRGEPTTLEVDGVIPGWTEGLQLMVEGEVRRMWIPQELAYKGQQGAPAGMLVFDIELVQIQ